VKEAFFGFKEKVMMAEFSEDKVSEVFQLILGIGVDEYIVHVHNHPSFSDFFFKDGVHHGLKGGGRVGKTKEHHGWFEKTLVGDEGRLPLVSVFDLYIVISPSYVYLGKELGAFEFIEEIGDSGEGVGVSDAQGF
jgi:hypothetical protein